VETSVKERLWKGGEPSEARIFGSDPEYPRPRSSQAASPIQLEINVAEPQTATSENRVLILFAHPALEKSRVNRHLVRAVRDLPGVTVHDLYEAYPEHDIDVAREQELLVEHDVVVFQRSSRNGRTWFCSTAGPMAAAARPCTASGC
jgi:hypothetical protein